MAIIWNKVTWYSKLSAAVFFIFILPVLTFFIGKEYGETKLSQELYGLSVVAPESTVEHIPVSDTEDIRSGILGQTTVHPICIETDPCDGEAFATGIAVKDSTGNTVTMTHTREDGKFLLILKPGTYTIASATENEDLVFAAKEVLVETDKMSSVTLEFTKR